MENLSKEKDLLFSFVEKQKNVKYKIDNNPSPEKISKIRQAIQRKQNLMNLTTDFYKTRIWS